MRPIDKLQARQNRISRRLVKVNQNLASETQELDAISERMDRLEQEIADAKAITAAEATFAP